MLTQPELKRIHPTATWGRGVTAARQTFNLDGVGSNPSGPTRQCGDDIVADVGA